MEEMEDLFCEIELRDVFKSIEDEITSDIEGFSKDLITSDAVQVASNLFEKYHLRVPIFKGEPKVKVEENIDIDVSYRRDISLRSGTTVKGTRFTFIVNFEGDANIFRVYAVSFGINAIRGDVS